MKGKEKMVFNSVGFCVLGIPAYFFCAVAGFVIAVCIYIILLSAKNYSLPQHMKALIISIISLMIFTKLFGCLSGIYRAIGMGEKITVVTVKNTGIVFYGGLFGLVLAYVLCIKYKLVKENDYHSIDLLAVTIPLFHSISRIGCFLAGCCFGKESSSRISIWYTTIIQGKENTALRLPVQLLEAGFDFLLFVYLAYLVFKPDWERKNIFIRYLIIYSCGRFLLEFIRGDLVRGVVCGISFSQMLSIFIWIALMILNKRKREDIRWER